MNLDVQFRNKAQEDFYWSTKRNQCFSGGFNNGKTFVGCFKELTLLTSFSNYRTMIARQTFSDLKRTTMQTFFKMCPSGLIESHNSQDGVTLLKNKSLIYWMHLDNTDENSLRGLEVNSILIDQAEETEEKVYDVVDARLGRWGGAIPNKALLKAKPNWPKNQSGDYIVPSYTMLLCNPDTQFHYIYRKYHPQSLDRRTNYFYCEGEWDASLGSSETYEEALKHDEEWVSKYVKGQWGISNAQIHRVREESLLDYDEELFERILKKGNLFRILDHGETSPTCCLWCAILDGVHIFYREYYVPNKVISYHRRAITDLSGNEQYSSNYADPQIFKKTAQKDGGFWTVADEYGDKSLAEPPLWWIKADNNEFATRNRINELLTPNKFCKHPVIGKSPAPGIYFIKKSQEYANGIYFGIQELQSQRRELLGYFDGKAVYSDEREKSITDHAYDCIRYKIAMHGSSRREPSRKAPPMSFKWFNEMKKKVHGPAALSA